MSVEEVAANLRQALGKIPAEALTRAGQELSEAIETLRPIASESTDPELHEASTQLEEADRETDRIIGICNRVRELVTGYLDQIGANAQPDSNSPAGAREPARPQPKSQVDKLREELPVHCCTCRRPRVLPHRRRAANLHRVAAGPPHGRALQHSQMTILLGGGV
ncbi:hypothetical protein HUO13_18490 [Saccharopolyspora erythraea]|uniref:hypothetical protein n=1 Tax=Saccharopolyspora erythraea TaxID=1836 RepID=UPI001BA9122E|nr:hypothetical protein [Saccharopolyspora erythraea]QUH02527.1 hypothetical protein HUO13_18490 [Saccharopolyspora erythraea]